MDYQEIIRTQLVLIPPVHRHTPVVDRGITAAVREITAAVRDTTVVVMLAMTLGHISKIIKLS